MPALYRSKPYHIGPIWTPETGYQLNEMFDTLFIDQALTDTSQITTGILAVVRGGTGLGLYTIGDLLYADSTTTLKRLADIATGNVLLSGGIGAPPSWGKVSLTAAISGILGVANGGTGVATAFTPGSIVFAGTSGLYSQDNAKFFWDNTTFRLGIGTASPAGPLSVLTAASDSVPQLRLTDGTVQLDAYIAVAGNAQFGTLTNHDLNLFTNGAIKLSLTKGGHTLFGGAADNALVTIKGDGNTSATYAVDVVNSSAVDLFRVRNDGRIAAGTSTFASGLTLSKLSDGALPATLTNADLYLHIGGLGFATNGYALIGFGYSSGVATNFSPAYIGYQEILDTGNTKGDLVFGTRDVTTATQPVERLRILAAGGIQVGKTVTSYNGIATASGGMPAEYATIDTTGLTANVTASTLYAVPSTGAGLYRVSAYVVETTAGSLSSTLPNVQLVYTDNDTGGSITMDATPVLGVAGIGQTGALTANTVGTASSGVIVVNVKASTTIQYQTVNYGSNLGGMTYALHLKLEAL